MKRILLFAATALSSVALAQPAIQQTESISDTAESRGPTQRVAAIAGRSFTDVRVERRGERVWVRAQSDVDADRATIWSTLSDYDHLAQFIPDMSSSRAISRDGSEVLVEQEGTAAWGPIRQKFTVLLAVSEELGESIRVSGVGGDFKHFDARYDIVALSPNRSRIVYEATLAPNTMMPSFVTLPVMRALINSQFSALVQEVLRRAA